MRLSRRLALALLCASIVALQMSAAPTTAQTGGPPFRGSAKGVLGPVALHAGLVVLRARANGAANFVVSLVAQDPDQDLDHSFSNRYLLIDAIGRYDGAVATSLRADASYFVEVSAASGPYEIGVEQPTPASVTATDQRAFSGTGQQALAPVMLTAGSYSFSVQSESSVVIVRLFAIDDLGGGAATSDYDARVIDTGRDPSTAVSVAVPADGLYLITVDPEGTGTLKWTLTVQ